MRRILSVLMAVLLGISLTACSVAVCLEGISVEAKNMPDTQDTVEKWLTDIGLSGSEERKETAIRITVGDITLDGVLYDTALAEEIKEYFPLTISMGEYGGREYYGGVEFYPENLEGGKRILKMVKLLTAKRTIIWPSSMHRRIIPLSL